MSEVVREDESEPSFEELVAPLRRELTVHAYRLLGSTTEAEDAVQEALIAAWRGLDGLRDRTALRAWLYRITTNAALRVAEKRGPRLLSWDAESARRPDGGIGEPLPGPWVAPFQDPDPVAAALRREHIELAWIAALQQLPALQRAAIVLKEALAYSAAEIAELLETTPPAVHSALQRARETLRRSDGQVTTAPTPDDRAAAAAFATAFTAGDVAAIRSLLADDVRFTMPPLPAWFDGRADVLAFLSDRVLATPWRVTDLGLVNGHPALLGYQQHDGSYRKGAVMVLHIEGGMVRWLATFIDPGLVDGWPVPDESGIHR
ncbi:RNA polymerase subunit sigma-70 [Microbacterium sp. PMB16]|uniref:RNA polymerase subunit sigma-70 n=1 Tax=Microbacterium sp. PMB16 TaxID=3120157 RepID=UPI003F4B664F